MPKKTKKQKILAELRRKLKKTDTLIDAPNIKKTNSVKRLNDNHPHTASISLPASLEIQKNTVTKPKTNLSVVDYSHVKHDLIRITIFSLVALVIQGVLYFVLRRG